MKSVIYYLFLLIFLLTCCEENEQNINLYCFELGNNKTQNVRLNINRTDTKSHFEYIFKSDSLKNIRIHYLYKEDAIIVNLDTLYKITNNYKSNTLDYKMYQINKYNNVTKTFVFNEDFGLLASLGAGLDRVFLEDSISRNTKEFIFKELYINLNI